MDPLTVMSGRIAPLGIEIDAVVVRVPLHVLPVRKECHRQRRRHLLTLHDALPSLLVSDLEARSPLLHDAAAAVARARMADKTLMGGSMAAINPISPAYRLPKA